MSEPSPSPYRHPAHGISEREVDTIAIDAIFTFLAAILVVLRFVSRRVGRTAGYWWDDWAALLSLLAAIAFLVLGVVDRTVGGAGYHIQTYSREQLSTFFQLSLAVTVVYNISITLSKASVLFLYERIFSVDRQIHKWIQIMLVLLLGYFLSAAGGLIFSTTPVEAQWKFWIPHTSIHKEVFYLIMGIVNVLFDIAILCIPQTKVWKLHQPRRQRLMLSLVFLLGGFVCITSLVRIVSILTIDASDLTYTFHNTTIWTIVEMNVSVMCACLPVLPNLLTVAKQKIKSINTRSKGSTPGMTEDSSYLRLTGSSNGVGQSIRALPVFETNISTTLKSDGSGMIAMDQLPSVHTKNDVVQK